MQKPPPWELTEPVHTTAIAPDHIIPARPSIGSNRYNGTFSTTRNSARYQPILQSHIGILEREFQTSTTQIPQTLEAQLAATRQEESTHPLPPAAAIIRELGVRNKLIQRKSAELQHQTRLSHGFYGSDPTNKSADQFLSRAQVVDKTLRPDGPGMTLWKQSYRAALQAKLLTRQLALLHEQQVNVHNWLAAVQANDHAQAAAAEAARQAAEQARIAAEQQRQRDIAEAARRQREQAEIRAREQARLAALAEQQRVSAEQARIAAEAAARQTAAEQARLEAQANVNQVAEKVREAKASVERLARHEAMVAWFESWKAARASRPFPVSGYAVAAGPVFTLATGRLATSAATSLAVKTALQTAVATATATGAAVIVGFAALLYPSTLGNGESRQLDVPLSDLVPDNLNSSSLSLSEYQPESLHALSIQLAELTAFDPDELFANAEACGRVRLPVAIGTRTVQNTTEFFVAATNGNSVPDTVPVRIATFDPSLNVYKSYNPDSPSIGITWTPIVRPENASTSLPTGTSNIIVYDGTILIALEGRTDTSPEFDLYTFGGFVTVFPADSGIPPIFTMFKDRRNDPGVVSGYGESASSIWLGVASTPEGAPIPAQIADKLRDRQFSNFKGFRKAFWKAVGRDQVLLAQFSRLNKTDLRDGLAPSARPSEQLGKRKKYELHHITPISEGGAVYDIDNLTVLTPKQHVELHSK